MAFRNLKTYLHKLKEEKEIVTISAPVDPYLELAEIHRRVIAADGPALLFTNVRGKAFPIVTNLFGTKKRVDLAFGKRPEELIRSVVKLAEKAAPPKLSTLIQNRHTFMQLLRIGTKQKRSSPMFHTIPDADLTQLPALTSWEEDGGPFLTLPLVHTYGKKSENLGIYRVQIHSAHEAGMHFQIGKGGGFHLYEAEQENRPLPVNIYLGGPPALLLSAIAPLPENVPEFLLASLVTGKKLNFHKKATEPAKFVDFEFCLEGEVPPHIRKPEGPFGDHYGYYSLLHDYPVFRVKNIYHCKDPIYPATVVGKPRQEDYYIGNYLQEMLSPIFPFVMPQIRDLWSYGETGFHALSAAVIRERYSREAMSAAFRILGEGQLSLTKCLFLIDKDMDLKNFRQVLTHLLERVNWQKDLYVFSQLSMDSLDYTGPKINHGSKAVVLGLGEKIRTTPQEFKASNLPNFIRNVKVFCPGCLVVEIPGFTEDQNCVEHIAGLDEFKDWPLLVAVDNAKKTCMSEISFLWTVFTRFEPAADIHAKEIKLVRHQVSWVGPIVIDARMKPWYPKELFCDHKTRTTVNNRWDEYFPNRNVTMGSSDDAHLWT